MNRMIMGLMLLLVAGMASAGNLTISNSNGAVTIQVQCNTIDDFESDIGSYVASGQPLPANDGGSYSASYFGTTILSGNVANAVGSGQFVLDDSGEDGVVFTSGVSFTETRTHQPGPKPIT